MSLQAAQLPAAAVLLCQSHAWLLTVSDSKGPGEINCEINLRASQKYRLPCAHVDIAVCFCTSCAGGEPTDTLALTDDSCEDYPDNGCETCDGYGCATCRDGAYTFFTFLSSAYFKFCFDCQPLNCAPGGCSNEIGASPDLMTSA